MASEEEPRAHDTRGLPGASASQSTTEESQEQAGGAPLSPTPERNGEAAPSAREPSRDGPVVSPARPRGVASFPGGPPPVVTPVPDLPTPPNPPPPPPPRPAPPPHPPPPPPAPLAPEPADAEAEAPVEVEPEPESEVEIEAAAEAAGPEALLAEGVEEVPETS